MKWACVVYAIADNPYTKIGWCTKDRVEKRFTRLQTGNPRELSIRTVSLSMNEKEARRLEAELHLQFAEWHIRGEWFMLPSPQLGWLLEAINTASV